SRWLLTSRSFRDGLRYLSNFYCLPGRAGGSPNELEPLSRMYAGEVRKAYPEWILMGGIDVSQLLPFGAESEVWKTVRKTIDEAGAAGRFWIGSTTEIHPAAKLENVLAMWDEIEKYGYYDRKLRCTYL